MARFNLQDKSTQRRVIAVATALFALLVMGFYSATDPERLAHSAVLSGADWMGYGVCHRITSHSFLFNGRQLPLCARCTGMYLGAALTFITLFLAGRSRWSDLPPIRILFALLVLVGLMGIDGLNSYSHFFPNAPHLYEPQNWLRLLTGLGTGIMTRLKRPCRVYWTKIYFRLKIIVIGTPYIGTQIVPNSGVELIVKCSN